MPVATLPTNLDHPDTAAALEQEVGAGLRILVRAQLAQWLSPEVQRKADGSLVTALDHALQREIGGWLHGIQVALASGDGIVLYTDGITESEAAAGHFYGINRLAKQFSDLTPWSSAAAVERIIGDVGRYCGGVVSDDRTLVVLHRLPDTT